MPQTVRLEPVVVASVPTELLAGVVGPSGALEGSRGVTVTTGGLFKVIGQAVTGADEIAVVRFGPVPASSMWLLQRYVVSVENDPGSQCSLYIGDPVTPNLEDGTLRGDLDVADGAPPIMVPGGEVLTFQWVSAGVGNVATARIQYLLASSSGA